jgi:amino acid transporter
MDICAPGSFHGRKLPLNDRNGIVRTPPIPESQKGAPSLKRSLSLFDLLVYGLVFITPIAPFAAFGIVFNASAGMVPLVYIIGLVAMLFTALSYVAMSRAFPVAGSVYAYANGTLGKTAGFIAGWAMLLDYLLIPALVYIGCAIAIETLIPGLPRWLWAIALLAINTTINLLGIENTAKANLALLVLQLIVLAIFLVMASIAVADGVNGAHLSMQPIYNAAKVTPALIFGALSLAVLNFLGFDAISTLAEEAKGGAAAVGKATLLALAIAATLFILQTYLASLLVLNRTSFPLGSPSYAAFYDVAALVGGPWLRGLTSVGGVLLAGMAGALTAQASTARLLFSMGRDGTLPRRFSYLHPERKVPTVAIVTVAAITAALLLFFSDRFVLLSTVVSFGALIGFLFLHPSVIVYYRKQIANGGWARYLLAPSIGFVIIAYVLFNMERNAKLLGICWLAIGAVVAAIQKFRATPSRHR